MFLLLLFGLLFVNPMGVILASRKFCKPILIRLGAEAGIQVLLGGFGNNYYSLVTKISGVFDLFSRGEGGKSIRFRGPTGGLIWVYRGKHG